MDVKVVDFIAQATGAPSRKEAVQPKVEKPVEEKSAPADRVDVHKPDTPPPKMDSFRAGNMYRYTVDSEHDLVIKVRDMETRREIKEIPSTAYQAAKRAYNKVISKIIDRKA